MPSRNKFPAVAGSNDAARTSVTAASTEKQLIASSADRYGVSVTNDSDKKLYLGVGSATVSTTNFTAKLDPDGHWESPFSYSGEIRGIWEANVTGSARITEYL
jgi:hypothetical protein